MADKNYFDENGNLVNVENKSLAEIYQDGAKSVNHWIPCSDRLPEQGQRVIVQFQYNSAKNHTAISSAQRAYSGGWIVDVMSYADKDFVTVQAWMPMPSAYEPEKE